MRTDQSHYNILVDDVIELFRRLKSLQAGSLADDSAKISS